MIKEMVGLKCPNHDYVRDNHHFMYKYIQVLDLFQAHVA